MKNVWLLTKMQLGSAFDLNIMSKNKKSNKKRNGLALYGGILIFALLLAGISFIYSFGIGISLQKIEMLQLLPELMMAVTCIITITTTIYKVKGTLFGFKDYDVVMALPVKTSEIVASRLLLLYIINMAFTFIVIAPANLAYGILAKASPLFYVISLLTIFFIPLVPMILATIIGTIIAVISARFRHSSLINILISLGFLTGFMALSFALDDSEEMLGEMSASLTKSVDDIYPLARMYTMAVCDYDLLSIILFLAISIFAFVMFSWLVGIKFKSINTNMASSRTKANYKIGKLEQTSPFAALYRKEIKRYFSSSIYVMNTAVGIVMMTIGAIATLFMSPEAIAQVLEVPGVTQYIASYAPIIISMFVVMTYITACSISLEGKNLWILKASPVSTKTIFNSKMAVNLTVTMPAIIVDGIIIAIGLKLTWGEFLILLAMPTAYACFTAIVGLIINLKLPNLNWTTEITVVKQSAAGMIAALGGLLTIIVPVVLIIILPGIHPLLGNGLITLMIAISSFGLYYYLNTKGAKLFAKL